MDQISKKEAVENTPYRASQQLHQALFEQAADGIFITDAQGFCVDVNPHGCKMLGYTREELLGVSMEDLVTAEDLANAPLELGEMRAGKTLLKERRLRCKDGRFLPAEISARMMANGRFLSIVRDISERRRAEEQVRESNERFRLLAESSLTGIYLIQDNQFRYVNPAMAHIFGYEVEEIIDKLGPMDLVYPDDQPLVAENVRRRVEGKDESIHYDFRGLRKDGTVIEIEVHGGRSKYGEKTGVIGTLIDITERKRAEEALQHNRETALQFSQQLATLQEVTNQLSKAESSDDLCRQAVQLGRACLGFDRVSIWFIEEHLGIMHGSFGTDERGNLRDERNARVEFRHEGLSWRVFSRKEPMALVEYGTLYDHLGQKVGKGDNALAALWDGDEVIGVICVDNFCTRQPIREHHLEILRLYATTLGHLITRKRAEEARHASESRFRTLVDHAADAFFLHDEWGAILDVNRQACESLGYSRDELIGMTPHDFDAALDHSFIDQMIANLDIERVIAVDTWHRRKDGSMFPVEVRTRPLWQGERRFSVSLARDMTEPKHAQEALTLFRTLIDHTNDAIEVIDPETGRFLDANKQAYHTLSYSREEFLNLTVPEIDPMVAKQSWEKTLDIFRHAKSLVFESQHQRKDGSIFPVEVNINYISLDRDYILSVVRDITERKQTEEELRRHRDHLEELVRDRTAKLSIAREKAESANQAKSEFLSNMSHELRTPLNSILGFTQILQQQTADTETSKRLGMVRQSGEHLLTLINDILDLSKIEARKLDLYPQPFHLLTFLQTIVHIIEERAQQKDLLLVYEIDETLPAVVQADETRLRQVLLNLSGNAVNYTDTGQVKLLVKRLDTPTDVDHSNPQALIRFEVSDTGVGMTPEQATNAFQPFEQVGDVSQRSKGTGLGLAISRQLVQLMGGDIHVESKPKTGSRFWFEVMLPLIEIDWSAPAASERIITGYKGPRLQVLVVDDIDSNRTMLMDMLAPLGFDTLEAADGRQALDLAQSHQPDLILMDRRMPEMDGLTATRQLRQLPGLQETPIISVSAGVSDEDQAEIMAAGCTASLPKPINWPNMAALLEAHLQLEWEIEEKDEGQKLILNEAEGMQDEEIVLPPRENLEALYELARLGSMTRIKTWTTQLAAQDAQYQPIADKLSRLAGEFEINRIIQLARQYLAQTE